MITSGHEWKAEVDGIDPAILAALHAVVCEQTDCSGRGFNPNNYAKCAWCADIAENVVGEYLRLTKNK